MKAITLWQPWAEFLAYGLKRIETRSWKAPTNMWGQMVAIHAAAKPLEEVYKLAEVSDEVKNYWGSRRLPMGAIVAVGRLVGSVETSLIAEELLEARRTIAGEVGPIKEGPKERDLGYFDAGRHGWTFEDVTPLQVPVKVKGAQGFWDVPFGLEREIFQNARQFVPVSVASFLDFPKEGLSPNVKIAFPGDEDGEVFEFHCAEGFVGKHRWELLGHTLPDFFVKLRTLTDFDNVEDEEFF